MAKAKTAGASKKKKAGPAKGVKVKVKVDGGKKGSKKGKAKDGFDALLKLADHPLVGDLLAVGAMAAVAAIADKGSTKGKTGGSSQAVKAAGKAAAAAIGARLLSEFDGATKASKPKTAKS
jgi:hypothetical protein